MPLNSSISASINPAGDYDYFAINIPAYGTLNVYTTGSTDTYGYLKDSACTDIESDDDDGEGLNFSITRTLSAGTYYVAVRHYSSSSIGAYTLVNAFNALTTSTTTSVTGTTSVSTTIQPTTTTTVSSNYDNNHATHNHHVNWSCRGF